MRFQEGFFYRRFGRKRILISGLLFIIVDNFFGEFIIVCGRSIRRRLESRRIVGIRIGNIKGIAPGSGIRIDRDEGFRFGVGIASGGDGDDDIGPAGKIIIGYEEIAWGIRSSYPVFITGQDRSHTIDRKSYEIPEGDGVFFNHLAEKNISTVSNDIIAFDNFLGIFQQFILVIVDIANN